MTTNNVVKITNRGMICIPANFRKKYNLEDGQYMQVIDDEGSLRLIPIKSTKELQEQGPSLEKVLAIIKESRKEDLELEE
ncbi:MAG TPA: AbrB/MazE/SpoVT family DNA-binding domain-containing protein [Candidatus Deferrimicrobium sp.]|nr:AbrB/MazE/SpoVT family DNA-binding domain-containing protein [Candidatus Deferrimicrobium sp.]